MTAAKMAAADADAATHAACTRSQPAERASAFTKLVGARLAFSVPRASRLTGRI